MRTPHPRVSSHRSPWHSARRRRGEGRRRHPVERRTAGAPAAPSSAATSASSTRRARRSTTRRSSTTRSRARRSRLRCRRSRARTQQSLRQHRRDALRQDARRRRVRADPFPDVGHAPRLLVREQLQRVRQRLGLGPVAARPRRDGRPEGRHARPARVERGSEHGLPDERRLHEPRHADATVTAKVRKGDGTQLSSAHDRAARARTGSCRSATGAPSRASRAPTDTNLWLEFTSDQPVLAFASVINNASGDPFAIVMTAEPNVSSSAPVASYTVLRPAPAPGQPVTFTDTSTNSPREPLLGVRRRSGRRATSGTTTHTYAAAGTYRHGALRRQRSRRPAARRRTSSWRRRRRSPFPSSRTTNNNTNWTFTPNNVTLKVGQPYRSRGARPQSEGKTHGVGGLAVLGITQTDLITSNRPYVVNFTPTAGMVGSHTYGCTVIQCAPSQTVHDGMTATITIVP